MFGKKIAMIFSKFRYKGPGKVRVVTMKMIDHAMWSSNLKIAHTKEAVNTVICMMTSITDSVDKICVARLMNAALNMHII